MRSLSLFLFLSLTLCHSLRADPGDWILDQEHSSVNFSVNHMKISEIHGQFKNFMAAVEFDERFVKDTQMHLTIEVDSIDTGLEQRDEHLRSPDFFNTREHPKIYFKSHSVRKIGRHRYRVNGDLTLKGVTKPAAVVLNYAGVVKDYWGNKRAGFKVSGTFNRFEHGLNWNELLEAGGLIVGEEVRIDCNFEMFQPSADSQLLATDTAKLESL